MKKVTAMPIGIILLSIAILMEKYLPDNSILDFIEGLFIGLSLVINIYYIIVVSQKNKIEKYTNH